MSTGGSSSTPSSSVSSPASFAASLPVGTLTSSLLIYLAYKAGLDRRTGETAEHLISFHCAIVSCNGHSLNQQSKQKRPAPFWPQGRVSSATATAISNIRTLEPQAQKQITRRAAYRERDDRTSIGLPSGNHWRDASLAPSCEDYVNVVPALRAGHPRGLNLTRRTVSAPTTVADLIGDLAALHQHFVKGRVVGSGFCHSE
jgi:hypothetical protein